MSETHVRMVSFANLLCNLLSAIAFLQLYDIAFGKGSIMCEACEEANSTE